MRNAQLDNYNFILVIGDKEQQTQTVNVRTRDNKVHGQVSVDEVLSRFARLRDTKTNKAEEEFGGESGVEAAVDAVKLDEAKSSESGQMDPAKYC